MNKIRKQQSSLFQVMTLSLELSFIPTTSLEISLDIRDLN